MRTKKCYWIKARHNPQLDKPYYLTYGQLSKRDAKEKEKTLYGSNYMMPFQTEAEYLAKIEELKAEGFAVRSG